MARKVGYTRAIEGAPDLPAQREAVLRAGCTEVYVEHSPANVSPAPQWADFRTPLPGYYFGAAGAHPGGGVMGAAGKMAATEILKDWQ